MESFKILMLERRRRPDPRVHWALPVEKTGSEARIVRLFEDVLYPHSTLMVGWLALYSPGGLARAGFWLTVKASITEISFPKARACLPC